MKGLMVLHNNFEDCEAIVTRAVLIKSNIKVKTATPNPNLNVTSSTKLKIKTDILTTELNLNNDKYDFLILPGGPYVQELFLEENKSYLKNLFNIIKYFSQNKKVIGAICAAPSFLGKIGLLKNKKFTCYPGYEKYIDGIYCPLSKAITSDNLITSRSPDTVFQFAEHLIKKLII
ncbi:MAG: 4-methyl-5(beta-hydroxyethyl)-thiazole monophosphate synthesis protein [Candidatus Phytoplasma cynodontis]|uniref:DJ-1/PfpI family protein n=1 Tax='Cynodon dactylon' phytoplasma TaxID=295320 RepID=UPI001265BF6D|nr:DJ-1/PfpI family protein ['Cynodon dactylon' phytoplasma]KAB8122022.1 DJ-1/PfpI family protein ['Cynodon dactylon' phytoplasma]WIA07561.1 MAG: 4-methyl-5(beta-hydroxyethyl)-thiazole monophosphate synthesis protein [Candidatus Phytoplasma cynodontis]